MRRRGNPSLGRGESDKQIASERMRILLKVAQETFREDPALAQRYVRLAKEIGMRYKVRIPTAFRHMTCRHCKSLIIPGVNARVRLQRRREAHVVITCFECGGHMRIPTKER